MNDGVQVGNYVRRVVDGDLDEVFAQLPAILLDGPKGVGKTATALQRCATVRRLDVGREREIVATDPDIVAADPPPVLIDEWHNVPGVWDAVRRIVDSSTSAGRFLLTGSPPAQGTHSGAGRIASLRMRPMCLSERNVSDTTVSFSNLLAGGSTKPAGACPLTLTDYTREIVTGGFPGMRHLTGRALNLQLDSYLARIVDHDLPEAGYTVRRPATIHAWMRAYAAATATSASWETIRDAATGGTVTKPSKPTTSTYTELLTTLRILDPVEAWVPSRNRFSPLAAAPKHHLVDPALAVRLLKRTTTHLLAADDGPVVVPRDGSLLGDLFESLVAQSIRTFAQAAQANVHHLRTRGGHREIDFIVERDGGVLAIEAKLSGTVSDIDVKHLRWLRGELGEDLIDAIIVNTGPEAYRRSDGIAVVPFGCLGP